MSRWIFLSLVLAAILFTNLVHGDEEITRVLRYYGEAIEKLQSENALKQQRIDHLEEKTRFWRTSWRSELRQTLAEFQNTTVSELEVRVEELEADLFDTQNEVQDVKTSVVNLGNNVIEIETSVIDVDYRLQEVTEQVQNQQDNIGTNSQDISAIFQFISYLEGNTTNLDTRVGNIETDLLARSESAFLVSLTADVDIPNNALVPFDLVQFDTGSNYDISSSSYFAPVDGIYLFYGMLYCDGSACGSRLQVDGATVSYNNEALTNDADPVTWSKVIVTVKLTQGQSVGFETANGNYIYSGGNDKYTFFGGHLLF